MKKKHKYDEGTTPYVVEMPGHVYTSRKVANGTYRQIRWPITEDARRSSRKAPTLFVRRGGKNYWVFKGTAYVTEDAGLDESDVLALINEVANRRRLQLEKAHALQSMTEQLDRRGKREPIAQDVKIAVWQRDGGRCVECGSQADLEFDHIIPLAMGGANTMRNLQLLCAICNRRKGATLG